MGMLRFAMVELFRGRLIGGGQVYIIENGFIRQLI